MWRTELLNFSINQNAERAGQLRHIGFEDDDAEGFTSSKDVNGIEWELFSARAQDERIVAMYGVPLGACAAPCPERFVYPPQPHASNLFKGPT
jgi:hypothetical protein